MSSKKFTVWIDDESAESQEVEAILSNHYDDVYVSEVAS